MAAVSTIIAGVSAAAGIGAAASANKQAKAKAAAAKKQAKLAAAAAKRRAEAQAAAMKRQQERIDTINKERSDLAAQAQGGNKATVVLGSEQIKDTVLTETNKNDVSSKKKKKKTPGVGGLMSGSSNVGGL